MILDNDLQMSSSQAVTSTAASTNIIDQGAAGDAYRDGLFLVVQTREAATATGSATVNFTLETATDAAFTSPVTLFDSGAIGKASITLNSQMVKQRVPFGALRFLRVKYTVATGPLTAGKFDAFLTPDVKIGSQ
jgi:hypothetical protein